MWGGVLAGQRETKGSRKEFFFFFPPSSLLPPLTADATLRRRRARLTGDAEGVSGEGGGEAGTANRGGQKVAPRRGRDGEKKRRAGGTNAARQALAGDTTTTGTKRCDPGSSCSRGVLFLLQRCSWLSGD